MRSGTQYIAMVTELLSSYWRAHLVESYCKVSNISVTNWLRYLFSSYLNKIWLSVWRHHLANLHILKTWISLEWKKIFENSKQHFSAHKVYLFLFQNRLDRKDALFVIVVPLIKRLIKRLIKCVGWGIFMVNWGHSDQWTSNYFSTKERPDAPNHVSIPFKFMIRSLWLN